MLTHTTLVLSQAPDSLFAAANRCARVLGLGRLPKGQNNQIARPSGGGIPSQMVEACHGLTATWRGQPLKKTVGALGGRIW